MKGLDVNMAKLITLDEPNSVYSEMYRSIRTNIDFSSVDKEIKVLNVTSSVANEAKTTTACNLAIMSTSRNKKVLLVDLDLRNPSIHRAFNLKNNNGLTDMLVDFMKNNDLIDVNKYIKVVTHNNLSNPLHVLTSGTEVVNPTEILRSKKIKDLIDFLKNYYDEIILDSSPSGIIIDGAVTSILSDGTIFIIESGKTKIEIAKKTIEQLKHIGANILGVVLTKVPYNLKTYGYYNYVGNMNNNNDRIKIDVD